MTSSGSIVMIPYKKMQQSLLIRFLDVASQTDKRWDKSNNMLCYYY